ncbi:uncharacterized protein LOC133904379 [Phragmites australis]|uniref:uncharacterized protein LOC133904379 n=1 Tax=Phragmites australis TaxID=29695 RepID=UPI002D789D1E|nr:uncharacterized protein LOC133904379 [Phragmites australis]
MRDRAPISGRHAGSGATASGALFVVPGPPRVCPGYLPMWLCGLAALSHHVFEGMPPTGEPSEGNAGTPQPATATAAYDHACQFRIFSWIGPSSKYLQQGALSTACMQQRCVTVRDKTLI